MRTEIQLEKDLAWTRVLPAGMADKLCFGFGRAPQHVSSICRRGCKALPPAWAHEAVL